MVGMAGQRQEGQQHSNLLVATVSKLLHGLRGVEGRKSDLAQLHRRLFFRRVVLHFDKVRPVFPLPINFEIFYQSILAAGFLVPMLPPVG
jgi:hypothetical protein